MRSGTRRRASRARLTATRVMPKRWPPARIEALRRARREGRGIRPGVDRLFPEVADAFFAAERLRPDPVSVLDATFSIVVVLTGAGTLEVEHGDPVEVRSGQTLLVP